MKRHRHILKIIAVLIFVIGSVMPITAADDSAGIEAVIRAYYDCFLREDLEGFLDTQVLEPGEEREKTAQMTRNAWSAVGTKNMNIGPIEIALSSDKSIAAARYRASGTIFNKTTGESFDKEMAYIALLALQAGAWKIERVTPETLFMDEVKNSYELYLASQLVDKGAEDGSAAAEAPKPSVSEDLRLCFDFTKDLQGTAVTDLSGHKNNGAIHGAVQFVTEGLFFDGIDDYIEVPASESLHIEKNLTIIGDIIPWGYGGRQWGNIIWKGNPPAGSRNCDHREYGVWVNSGGFFHFASTPKDRIGAGQLTLNTPGNLVCGRTVFACIIDGEQNIMKAYVNGKKAAEGPYSKAGIRQTTAPLTIGGVPASRDNYYFKGYIKSLSVYARAFSDEEMMRAFTKIPAPAVKSLEDIYIPAETIARGAWADVSRISRTKHFSDRDMKAMKKGVVIEDGFFCHPGAAGPTEILYTHDGSPLNLSGQVAVLDCIDYCGQRGTVAFTVEADGNNLWQSGTVKQKGPAPSFSVNLTGVRQFRLITADIGDGLSEDWGAWLNLKTSVPEKEPASEPAAAAVSISESPSGETGTIDHIYTLIERPSGSSVTSVDNFHSAVDQVYIWFTYSNLKPGTILKGVWLDEGRKVTLQEFPVIITHKSGHAGFSIRRPLDGWIFGRYRLDLMSGESTMGTVNFQITK